jgi:uncharacterized protein
MNLDPNAAIPMGLRRKPALDAAALSGATRHAAGILFVAPDGDVLLLRRSPKEENFAGHWSLPGGNADEGETPELGAAREAKEEMGVDVDPAKFKVFDQTITPTGKAFHTFAMPADKKFWPTINDEHTGAGWFPLSELPRPIHPAVEASLKGRLGDDIAGARDGLVAWSKSADEEAEDIDLAGFVGDASFSEGDHPRAPDGKFGSGGSGSTGPNHHVIHEKGDHRPKASENEARMLGLNKSKPEDKSKHTGKKEISSEALTAKLKGMPKEKLEAALKNDDVDPMIKAHINRHLTSRLLGSDSEFLIAMDRDSVREKTRDGRLIVKKTHISKANVCPYRGKEIPGWQDLGLEPDRVYNLLRDPDELRKAAPTLNGVQLLIKHIPVSAEDHRPDETVGSLGTDAEFDGEYLDNSLFVNAKHAIDAIESGRQRELSAGYHYSPDMTPGNFHGTAFDGVMRSIVFNHVALVEDGRAGPDVVVGDQALKENEMAKATRFGAMTLSITAAAIAPLLAMDQKVTLPKDLFAPLTTKNFKGSRDKLLAGVRTAIDGKLRPGLALDGSMQNFAKAIDAFNENMTAGIDEPAPEDKQAELDKTAAVEPAKAITEPGSTYDAEPFKNFLREKGIGEDDIMKACDMMPKPMAGDEDDEEAKKKKEEEEKKAAADKSAKDAELKAKDAEMKDMVTKPAMDAAIAAAVDATVKRERSIRAAIAEVHPWTGDLPASMAFDIAADVFRHALVMKGVDGAKTLHADALFPILKTLPKPGARAPENHGSQLAMDASAVTKAIKLAPGLENISTSL